MSKNQQERIKRRKGVGTKKKGILLLFLLQPINIACSLINLEAVGLVLAGKVVALVQKVRWKNSDFIMMFHVAFYTFRSLHLLHI